MVPFQPEPNWYQDRWYGDVMGRTAEVPHPVVALGALLSSAVLIGLLVFGHVV